MNVKPVADPVTGRIPVFLFAANRWELRASIDAREIVRRGCGSLTGPPEENAVQPAPASETKTESGGTPQDIPDVSEPSGAPDEGAARLSMSTEKPRRSAK